MALTAKTYADYVAEADRILAGEASAPQPIPAAQTVEPPVVAAKPKRSWGDLVKQQTGMRKPTAIGDLANLARASMDTGQADIQRWATNYGLGNWQQEEAANRALAAEENARVSPETQQKMRDFNITFEKGVENPSLMGVAGNLVSAVSNPAAITGTAGGLLSLAPHPLAKAAGLALSTIPNAAMIGGNAAQSVAEQGGTHEQEMTAQNIGSVIGGASGLFEPAIAKAAVGRQVAKEVAGEAAQQVGQQSLLRRLGETMAKEGAQEAFEGGGQRAGENVALQRPTMEGVANQALFEGSLGALGGAGFATAGHGFNKATDLLRQDINAETTPEEDAIAAEQTKLDQMGAYRHLPQEAQHILELADSLAESSPDVLDQLASMPGSEFHPDKLNELRNNPEYRPETVTSLTDTVANMVTSPDVEDGVKAMGNDLAEKIFKDGNPQSVAMLKFRLAGNKDLANTISRALLPLVDNAQKAEQAAAINQGRDPKRVGLTGNTYDRVYNQVSSFVDNVLSQPADAQAQAFIDNVLTKADKTTDKALTPSQPAYKYIGSILNDPKFSKNASDDVKTYISQMMNGEPITPATNTTTEIKNGKSQDETAQAAPQKVANPDVQKAAAEQAQNIVDNELEVKSPTAENSQVAVAKATARASAVRLNEKLKRVLNPDAASTPSTNIVFTNDLRDAVAAENLKKPTIETAEQPTVVGNEQEHADFSRAISVVESVSATAASEDDRQVAKGDLDTINRLYKTYNNPKATDEQRDIAYEKMRAVVSDGGYADASAFRSGLKSEKSKAPTPQKTGYSRHQLTKAVKEWAGPQLNKRVTLHQSVDELMRAIGRRVERNTKGYYKNGQVHLVADLIKNDTDARAVLLHELGAHYGFSMREVKQIANELKSWANASEGSLQRRIYDKAVARVENAGVKPEHATEELVAYAVEESVNAGVSPVSIVGKWLNKLLRAIATKFGIKGMTPQDLVNYAFAAAQRSTAAPKQYAQLESLAQTAGEQMRAEGPVKYASSLFNKLFGTLERNVRKRFDQGMQKPLAGLVIKQGNKFLHERPRYTAMLLDEFTGTLTTLNEMSKKDLPMYNDVMKALRSEKPKKELLAERRDLHASLNKTFDGKTGWAIIEEARRNFQSMVVESAKYGVFVFNNKDISLEVQQSKEPTYWPRHLDHGAVRANRDEVVRILMDDTGVKQIFANEETRRERVEAFVDMLGARAFDDPVLNLFAGFDVSNKSNKDIEGMMADLSGFNKGDESELAMVLAGGFSAKNKRTMSAETAAALDNYYSNDAGEVIQRYTSQLGARMAAHEAFGGYISPDSKTFVKTKDERSNVIDNKINSLKEKAKAAGEPVLDDWYYKAMVEENADKRLTYSPVAFAAYATAELRRRGAPAHNTHWLRNTYFPAIFGMLGQDINPDQRLIQEAIGTAIRAPLLAFATITSITELGNIGVRAANPAIGQGVFKTTAKAAKEAARLMFTAKGKQERQQFAKTYLKSTGVVVDSIGRVALAAMGSDRVVSPRLRRFNEGYFKFTLLNQWTNLMAHVAYNLAHTAIDDAIASGKRAGKRELRKLGITEQEWAAYKRDRLGKDAQGNLTSYTRDQLRENLKTHANVHRAISTWVDGARLHPNAHTRTGWGNDPHYALLWMLNDFPYAHGAKTLDRIAEQYKMAPNAMAKAMPVIAAGIMFTLLGMGAQVIKRSLRGDDIKNDDLAKMAYQAFVMQTGPAERFIKAGEHKVMDYPLPFWIEFMGPFASLSAGATTRGLLPTMISSLPFLNKETKTELTSLVKEGG